MVAKANDLLTPAPVHGDRRGRRLCSVLVADPLHVLREHLLAAAVIKLCRTTVGMASDSLSGFKSAVIFQKIRDAGRAELSEANSEPATPLV
jgi:hypothetical protein